MKIEFSLRQVLAVVALILLFILVLIYFFGYAIETIKFGGIALELKPPANKPSDTSANPTRANPPATDSALSPDGFISDYYSYVNSRDYHRAWAMLSDDFKVTHHCCNDDGTYLFSSYADWWDTMAKVDILQSSVRSRGPSSAEVSATLRYTKQDDKIIEQAHLFHLGFDNSGWLIDDQQ